MKHGLLRGEGSSELTPRERQVAEMLAVGLSTKDVAVKLDITVKTVVVHTTNLMRKLRVHDRYTLIVWCIRMGWVPCPCGQWNGKPRTVPI